MRFWDTLCKEKQIKNCRAFLFAVARNLIIDWYRKKKAVSLEGLLFEGSEDKNELLSSSAGIGQDVMRIEALPAVELSESGRLAVGQAALGLPLDPLQSLRE